MSDGIRRYLNSDSIRTAIIVVLIATLVLTFMQPALLLGTRTAAITLYGDLVTGPVSTDTGEPLIIDIEDIEYLNRIFTEQDLEVGYCGLIDRDRRLRPWLAQLSASTETSLELSVRNCPTGAYPELALMHTHPTGDPRLTGIDRRSLRLENVDYLCIQHGLIRPVAGTRTDRLRCYSSASSSDAPGSIRQVAVRVIG